MSESFFEDVLKWSKESQEGLVCGIFGCNEPVDIRCKYCRGGYCLEHKEWHFHSVDNTGVIIK